MADRAEASAALVARATAASPPASPPAATTSSEDALRRELELLRGVLQVVKEDLNVKNEQLDFLYASVRSSAAAEKQLEEQRRMNLQVKLDKLEHELAAKSRKEEHLTHMLGQLQHLHGGPIVPWASLPPDTVHVLVAFLDYRDICAVSQVCTAWHPQLSAQPVWRALYAKHFGTMDDEAHSRRLQSVLSTPPAAVTDAGPAAPTSPSLDVQAGAGVGAGAGAGAGVNAHAGVSAAAGAPASPLSCASPPRAGVGVGAGVGAGTGRAAATPPVLPALRPLDAASACLAATPSEVGAGWRQRFARSYQRERAWQRGRPLQTTLSGHKGTVTCVVLTDEHIVSGSDDGAMHLWSLVDSRRKSVFAAAPPAPPTLPSAEVRGRVRLAGGFGSPPRADAPGAGGATAVAATTAPVTASVTSLSATPSTATSGNAGAGARLAGFGSHTPASALSVPAVVDPEVAAATAAACRARSLSSDAISGGPVLMQQHHRQTREVMRQRSFHGHGGPVWCLDLCDQLLVSGSYDMTIKLWDVKTGQCQRSLRGHEGWVSCLAARDGVIVSGSWDSTVKVWDMHAGFARTSMGGGPGDAVHCLQWAPGTSRVATGGRRGDIAVWDIRRPDAAPPRLDGHAKHVYAVDFHDQRRVVSASGDNTVKVWDATTNKCVHTLVGHTSAVMCVQAAGPYKVVSGSYDKSVAVWDVRRPDAAVRSLQLHSGAVFCLAFDETRLVTGSADCTVKLCKFQP